MPFPKKPQQPQKKPVLQQKPVLKSTQKKKLSPLKKLAEAIVNLTTIPLKEKLFFAANLRVMIKAGLSMSEALDTLSMQTKNKKFQKMLQAIRKGVMQGNTLGSQLGKYPKIFPAYFVNMIKVGEKSGNLEKNLEQLAIQMKKDHELKAKIRGAMIYPSVIIAATIGIVILMFVYVIPNVLAIFEELDVELPLATKILIAISRALTDYGGFVAAGVALVVGALIAFSRTKKGKKINHWIILHLPIIGPIAMKVNLARFSRTISSLLKTDIPVVESFKITSSVLSNVYYKDVCYKVSQDLTKGIAVNSILKKSPKLFPPLVTQMTLVGEKSGTLDVLLGELAEFYETEVSEVTKNMSSIIEPILILFLGGVVGLIAFAVISPMYTLSQSMD